MTVAMPTRGFMPIGPERSDAVADARNDRSFDAERFVGTVLVSADDRDLHRSAPSADSAASVAELRISLILSPISLFFCQVNSASPTAASSTSLRSSVRLNVFA